MACIARGSTVPTRPQRRLGAWSRSRGRPEEHQFLTVCYKLIKAQRMECRKNGGWSAQQLKVLRPEIHREIRAGRPGACVCSCVRGGRTKTIQIGKTIGDREG